MSVSFRLINTIMKRQSYMGMSHTAYAFNLVQMKLRCELGFNMFTELELEQKRWALAVKLISGDYSA